jgi:hypothetical protein
MFTAILATFNKLSWIDSVKVEAKYLLLSFLFLYQFKVKKLLNKPLYAGFIMLSLVLI